MSDDETPDNVVQLPRIGSPPPPPLPLPPDLDGTGPAPDDGGGPVRISSFDAPSVPVAPQSTGTVPAALRADGLDPPQPAPDAGPPHASALTLAAVLAIALAAFEGLQSWIKEAGPRRLEAAKHQREMELLAAKSSADVDRLGAQANAQRARRVPSSHEYGRGALGRGPGSPGRSGTGAGSGGVRRNGTGQNTGHRSGGTGTGGGPGRGPGSLRPTSGSGSGGGTGRGPGSPRGSGGGSGGSLRPGSGAGSGRGPGSGGSGGSPGRGTKGGGQQRNPGPRGPGSSGGGTRGPGGRGGGTTPGPGGTRTNPNPKSGPRPGNGTGTGPGGRRTPRQVISDVLRGKRRDQTANGSRRTDPQSGTRPASTQARIDDCIQRQARKAQPTRWEALGSRIRDRWKRRREADTASGANRPDWTPPKDGGRRYAAGDQDRVTLGQAVADAFWDRWEKRREHWRTTGGPRHPRPPRKPKKPKQSGKPKSGTAGTSRGPAGPGPASGTSPGGASQEGAWAGPRSSPFDVYDSDEPEVTITSVVQDGPARSNAERWEPDQIAPARPALSRQGPPALPRAPQRPAGSRPGTTRRKEPIAMPPAPRSASSPGAVAPVSASIPAPGGMSAQHATELRLDTALKALEALTTSGMETHDDCAQLARLARRLLGEIEAMAHDLARNHNVTGAKTMRAVAALLENVGDLVVQTERMARDCLAASELAEAEEAAMARDHRPMQTAYLDAGVAAPSARIHNEN
ncbi:hypothetical protein [Streptomyces sp. NPDC093990]|uniref:hypothetical protein n=1 Tax=Streptomyces sp. NPDC093990 TaxID=3155306 RepID=UPI0034328EAE